jgi:hypothetical protein
MNVPNLRRSDTCLLYYAAFTEQEPKVAGMLFNPLVSVSIDHSTALDQISRRARDCAHSKPLLFKTTGIKLLPDV